MPQVALGTFQIPPGQATYDAVLAALKAGYRKIDTAHGYFNERDVGRAFKDSGVPRKDIWITSKLWVSDYGEGKTLKAIDLMLKRLGTDYIDLLYLHQADGDYLGAYKDLEKAYEQKKVRSIGISNFDFTDDLWNGIVEKVRIKPHVTQIELNPFFQQKHFRELISRYDVKIDCYFPFGGRAAGGSIFKNDVIAKIAAAKKKSPAQVVIRWGIQEGFSILPGSTNPAHIASNLDVFDFELSADEMDAIRKLDTGKRQSGNTHEAILNFIKGYKVPED